MHRQQLFLDSIDPVCTANGISQPPPSPRSDSIYAAADWQPVRTQKADLLEAQLAPELAALSAVLSDAGTLAVEFVVLGSGELLGALGAVVAAAGAGRSAGEGHARGLAGSNAGGVHGGWWWSGDWCVERCWAVACDDSSEVWCERKLELRHGLGVFVRFALIWRAGAM